jgi:hypothetical protein
MKIIKKTFLFSLKTIYRFLKLFGFDIRTIFYLKYYPKFLKQKKLWLNQGGKITNQFTILSDYNDHAGKNKGHYFHQDLLISSLMMNILVIINFVEIILLKLYLQILEDFMDLYFVILEIILQMILMEKN